MSVKLNSDDSCAVDLLLEHSTSTSQGVTSCFSQAPSSEVQQRLTRIEELLHLLDSYSVGEPGEDLVASTLARCEQRATIRSNENPPIDPIAAVS